MEDILKQDDKRLVAFPIQHPDLWDMYKKQLASIWTTEELDLSQDLTDWSKLNENEQYFIEHVLAFFAASDGIVNENLCERFANEVQYYEARANYHFQMAMEDIHSETYSLLIDTYVSDPKKKDHLLNAIKTIPAIQEKAEWAMKWIKDGESEFAKRLLAFAIVEGVFFSGSFCSIFWLKKRGLMPGLTFSNELISRDEGMHTDFAAMLYKDHIENKLSQEEFYEMLDEGVQIEIKFICESLPVSLLGMSSELMTEYLKYTADMLCRDLGYESYYNARQPFDWMDLIALEGKTNFFERRVSEYSKAGVGDSKIDNEFSLDADF
jgi:ribonucleoside-diphosphate reductase beta chain